MAKTLDTTPKADGYRMPGEFEPHSGCWMVWPERTDNWRHGAKPAQTAFVEVAEAIHPSDPVTMAVSAGQYAHARALLSPEIRVVEMSSNDSWMRDIGPSFVIDAQGGKRAVDWIFNAWGGLHDGLYFPWDRDDEVAQKIAEIEETDRYRAPIVLEGGSIHVDGEGTLITTEECLLSPGRNPELSKEQIEEALCEYTGVEKVIWIPRGVYLDETNGHVDNLIHFCAPGIVALTWTEDKSDPQAEISAEAFEFLSQQTDARGRSFEIIKLPSPGPILMTADEATGVDVVDSGMLRREGDRMAGSYANFYIGNTRVVYPLLDERYDEEAGAILAGIFPHHEIVGVCGREILLGGGNVHCITQQVPR